MSTSKALALPLLSPADGLTRYLQQIRAFPVLDADEEYMLAKRWQEHGDLAAAHRLTTSHLRLVAKIAGMYRGYGLPAAEMIAEGNIGLMQAVKRFDPDKGFRLSTYAMWWIRAAMQEFILRSWSLVKIGTSAAQKRLFFNLRKIKKKIGAGMAPELTHEQTDYIAEVLDVSASEVTDMHRRLSSTDQSLSTPIGEDGEGELIDLMADPADNQEVRLADAQEYDQKRALLQQAMATLNPREQAILQARRLSEPPLTLEELSQTHNISRERVRQIEVRAMEKLQKAMLAARAEA